MFWLVARRKGGIPADCGGDGASGGKAIDGTSCPVWTSDMMGEASGGDVEGFTRIVQGGM